MKKVLVLIAMMTASAILAVEYLCSMPAGTTLMAAGSGGLMLAASPITLSTQKIVFLTSLKEEYEKIDTWLNETEDLSAFVADGQTLQFPESGADPEVYKNRVTDIDSVEPEETVYKVDLDIYDSQNYKIRNVYLHALPFEKIQHYTRKSANAIVKKEIADAAYAFAPTSAGRKKIILPTTGNVRDGVKMMRLDDIVTLARACDANEFPEEGRNVVLTSDMWWDLVNNNEILKGQLERTNMNGNIEPKIVEYYGFKIHKSLGSKLGVAWDVDGETKAPQGSAFDVAGGVVPAALLFLSGQVFRASGSFEMFYRDKSIDPEGRAYTFGFQHRSKSDFQMDAERYSGLIYMAPSAEEDPENGE
jgi:hypothetical protein